MNIIDICKEAVERIGRNWVGNTYKYRWSIFIVDNRKESYGLTKRINGSDIPIKRIFTGTKTEVKTWLKDHKIEWNWNAPESYSSETSSPRSANAEDFNRNLQVTPSASPKEATLPSVNSDIKLN